MLCINAILNFFFFFQAEDGIRDYKVTGVQTCALPISHQRVCRRADDFSDGTRGDARVARGGGVCRGPHAGPARGGARSGGGTANLSMFYILLQEFIGDLKVQRTRAFLTFFAVTWGTLAVVLLLAFGEGLKRTVRDGLLGAGERIFMIYGGETSKAFAGLGQGRRIRLVEEDLDLVRSASPDVDRGSSSYGRWGTSFQMGKTRTNAFLEGVGFEHETIRHMEPAQGGRFINPTDVAQKRRVLFLGTELAERIFGKGVDPVA